MYTKTTCCSQITTECIFFKIVHCTFCIKEEGESYKTRTDLSTDGYYISSCDRSTSRARHQRSPLENTIETIAIANPATLLNTSELRSNQMHQTTNTPMSQKAFLLALVTLFLDRSHHSINLSPTVGERWCQPLW
jgi:hypothetical protein